MTQPRVGFLGAGQMATALAIGFVRAGMTTPEQITAYAPSAASRGRFKQETGASTETSNAEVAQKSDVLFFAVKPQMADAVFASLDQQQLDGKLLVSVMAGIPCTRLAQALGSERVIRVLPTTPCLIGKGIAAISAHPGALAQDLELIEQMMGAVAVTQRLPERSMDAVTGMANPAYVFQFMEAMADGGVLAGLSRAVALRLSAHTVLGAAAMVLELEEHPTLLKERVASPAGTTMAGLHELERGGLRATMMTAIAKSTQRSRELGTV